MKKRKRPERGDKKNKKGDKKQAPQELEEKRRRRVAKTSTLSFQPLTQYQNVAFDY